MKKLLTFVLWPALAGLAFALSLLLAPRLISLMPGLAPYFPALAQSGSTTQAQAPDLSFSTAISTAFPAVVSINFKQTVERTRDVQITPLLMWRDRYRDDNKGLGSGVVISPDGFIITSYHILFHPDADSHPADFEDGFNFKADITATFSDGRSMAARLVSLDEKNDLALLKVDAEKLAYLRLADTSQLERGDVVLAIGNPRNIGQSVTFGIISALWQRDDSYMIQTDAAINPGNSGGALINLEGRLIGINSTIVSESGGSEGISFAIPADKSLALLEQYLSSGPSGYLGVHSEILLLAEGQALFDQDVQGFKVNGVASNSPAEKAGILPGDIITGVNETKLMIREENDEAEAFRVIAAISGLPPGELIMVEVFRSGEFLRLPAILGIGEPQAYYEESPEQNPLASPDSSAQLLLLD